MRANEKNNSKKKMSFFKSVRGDVPILPMDRRVFGASAVVAADDFLATPKALLAFNREYLPEPSRELPVPATFQYFPPPNERGEPTEQQKQFNEAVKDFENTSLGQVMVNNNTPSHPYRQRYPRFAFGQS